MNFEIGVNVLLFFYYKSTDASALGFFYILPWSPHALVH